MKTDIQIAQESTMLPIKDVAANYGITEDDLELYGKYKAKFSDEFMNSLDEKQDGKQTITPSVSIALAVAESKQTWIYTLSLHKCWEHSENAIETAALAGSVLPEYVSF